MSSQIGKAPSKAVLAHGFSSQGILPSPPLPQARQSTLCQEIVSPLSAEPASRRKGGSVILRAQGIPWESRLTFHTHAVVEAFVVEAPVMGRAEMLPQVAAGPCQHSEYTWSAKLSGPSLPRCTRSHWTGDPSSLWQGRAPVGWAIWCARLPAGTTDGCRG